MRGALLVLPLAWACSACVPEGPSTADAGVAPPKPAVTQAPPPRPLAPIATASAVASASTPAVAALPLITSVFEDNFERAEIGPDYNALSPRWHIAGGRLCGKGVRNQGIWLLRRLPVNARIELDAIAESADGDLKIEAWGDGKTGANAASYKNATSYIAILGGWKNTRHVLARLDEHGEDRLALDVDPNSDDERARSIAAGQPYHFKIERVDGRTISWSVNNVTYFELPDPDPLTGPGHEHVGFNDWDVGVCFDNLKVTPL